MIRIHRIPILLGSLLVFTATATATAQGATLRVPSDYPSIQAGITAASAGDTVVVAPGTYAELILVKPGIVLRSSDGPETTTLECPGIEESPLKERIMECFPGIGRETVIEGFTFDYAGVSGTAIYCEGASPTIRGNVIVGFGWAINMTKGADALVEDNRIERSTSFGVMVHASAPHLRRNTFVDNEPTAITISGKDAYPVIGGSREDANRILGGYQAIRCETRNDIDATWNDWGHEVAAEMTRKGYPADIVTIYDGNNADKSHRGKGRIDYQNWLRPELPGGDESEGGFPMWIPIGLALLLAIGFVVVARR